LGLRADYQTGVEHLAPSYLPQMPIWGLQMSPELGKPHSSLVVQFLPRTGVKQVPADVQILSTPQAAMGQVQGALGIVQSLISGVQLNSPKGQTSEFSEHDTAGLRGLTQWPAPQLQYSLSAHTCVLTEPLTPVTG